MRWVIVIVLVLLGVPSWTGVDRLPLLSPSVTVHAAAYVPTGGWPRRVGALEPVGAVRLWANDPAFGGLSSLSVEGGAATVLSDGGNWARFAIRGNRLTTLAAGSLPAGPGTGWEKESRDTESMAVDPATGQRWVGYERANAIWRYAAGFARAEAHRAPASMRRWPENGGAESLVRLADGRFLVIAEQVTGGGARPALLFSGDPTDARTRVTRLRYLPPKGFAPSDAAVLPDGDLLVLNRRFSHWRFHARLIRIPRASLKPGAVLRGRVIAEFEPPLVGENCEGVAITREGGATMVWIVTDNDLWWLRPTLLMKFRLVEGR